MSKKQINLFVGSIGAFIGVFVFYRLYSTNYCKSTGRKGSTFSAAICSSFLSHLGHLWLD